jgi:DNA-binding transcriptional LysR family regulator
MELRHLRYFIAVAEERSFSRAAERLAIAQPPLSQQIRRLEVDLGFPLFERTPKGVRLTRAGEAFLPAARSVLEAADAARQSAEHAHRGIAGRLSIAYMNSAAYGVLPRLLKGMRDGHPGIQVDVREMTIADQFDALVDGRVDAGILRPPIDDTRLASIKLVDEPFVVALPCDHPLAKAPAIDPHALGTERLVGYPRGHPAGFRERVDATLRNSGITPRVVQEAIHIHTLCGLVAGGVGLAIVPAGSRAMTIDGVQFVPLAAPGMRAEVWLAWLRAAAEPQVQNLIAVAKAVLSPPR